VLGTELGRQKNRKITPKSKPVDQAKKAQGGSKGKGGAIGEGRGDQDEKLIGRGKGYGEAIFREGPKEVIFSLWPGSRSSK